MSWQGKSRKPTGPGHSGTLQEMELAQKALDAAGIGVGTLAWRAKEAAELVVQLQQDKSAMSGCRAAVLASAVMLAIIGSAWLFAWWWLR